jgi:hypothetical protein
LGIGTASRLTGRRLVLLLADWIGWKDTVVHRASPSNQAGSIALGPRYKPDDFAHIRSKSWLEKKSILLDDENHLMFI